MIRPSYSEKQTKRLEALRRDADAVIPTVAGEFRVPEALLSGKMISGKSKGSISARSCRARHVAMAQLARMGHCHGDIAHIFRRMPSAVSYALRRLKSTNP